MTRRVAALAIAGGLLVACGHAPSRTIQSLRGGEVASVGALPVTASMVADTARASGVSARVAVDRLVDDALAAQGARAEGLDRVGDISWPVTATIARGVLARLTEQAESAGPPTDDELATVTVAHAVVLRTPGVPEERAREVAGAIRQAVAGARTADDFEAIANAVPHSGTQLVVQRVSDFGADGRAEKGAEYDPIFVAAAFALRSPGQVSWVIQSSFGWHVIYLIERTAADRSSIEQRRIDLASDVVRMRVRIRTDSVLHARKERSSIEVSEAADALMADATKAP
ncbi:MAG: peptidyl-prolyl cis-trans isomerase [Polyangiaceae bacterium]